MLYVAAILGVVSLTGMVVVTVRVTAAFSRSLSNVYLALERIESRYEKQTSDLLDRLMTIRWENYAAIKTDDGGEEGEFILPQALREDDDEDGGQTGGQWGALASLRDRMAISDEERALLEEDFPEEFGREEDDAA